VVHNLIVLTANNVAIVVQLLQTMCNRIRYNIREYVIIFPLVTYVSEPTAAAADRPAVFLYIQHRVVYIYI